MTLQHDWIISYEPDTAEPEDSDGEFFAIKKPKRKPVALNPDNKLTEQDKLSILDEGFKLPSELINLSANEILSVKE